MDTERFRAVVEIAAKQMRDNYSNEDFIIMERSTNFGAKAAANEAVFRMEAKKLLDLSEGVAEDIVREILKDLLDA